MAAVGAEVMGSWLLVSGPAGVFILLLLLSIFLTALCVDCRRHSFELRDNETDRNPSSLVRVVKLEDAMGARANPMINEILSDEGNTPWRSHSGAPQSRGDVQVNSRAAAIQTSESETDPVPITLWRSHLGALQSTDQNGSAPADHIYHVIGRQSSGTDADVSLPPTNQEPADESGADSAANSRSLYARVSKKVRSDTPPDDTPEEEQKKQEATEEEESPPTPDRKMMMMQEGHEMENI